MDARAWPEVSSPARWTSWSQRRYHDERRCFLPLWHIRRCLDGALQPNSHAQPGVDDSETGVGTLETPAGAVKSVVVCVLG